MSSNTESSYMGNNDIIRSVVRYKRTTTFHYQLHEYLILIIWSFLILSCEVEDPLRDVDIGIRKKWTIIFYDDADFEGAVDPLNDFEDQAGSGKDLHIIVLQDTEAETARIWYIDENHNRILLEESSEVNMGSPETLYNFLDYAKNNCPADRYILLLYNHGFGWVGACFDKSAEYDNLTMEEMQTAITDAGGVDIIIFCGPCLMACIESVYELRDCTDIYIGSENYTEYGWWINPMNDLCNLLRNDPDISNAQLGEEVVKSIMRHKNRCETCFHLLTISAIATDKMAQLKDALDVLFTEYLTNIDMFRSHVDSVYHNTNRFSFCFVDIYDFMKGLLEVENDPIMLTQLEETQRILKEAVIAECHDVSLSGTHGLTIFFPDTSDAHLMSQYSDPNLGLDFAQQTSWDELINAVTSDQTEMVESPRR